MAEHGRRCPLGARRAPRQLQLGKDVRAVERVAVQACATTRARNSLARVLRVAASLGALGAVAAAHALQVARAPPPRPTLRVELDGRTVRLGGERRERDKVGGGRLARLGRPLVAALEASAEGRGARAPESAERRARRRGDRERVGAQQALRDAEELRHVVERRERRGRGERRERPERGRLDGVRLQMELGAHDGVELVRAADGRICARERGRPEEPRLLRGVRDARRLAADPREQLAHILEHRRRAERGEVEAEVGGLLRE